MNPARHTAHSPPPNLGPESGPHAAPSLYAPRRARRCNRQREPPLAHASAQHSESPKGSAAPPSTAAGENPRAGAAGEYPRAAGPPPHAGAAGPAAGHDHEPRAAASDPSASASASPAPRAAGELGAPYHAAAAAPAGAH